MRFIERSSIGCREEELFRVNNQDSFMVTRLRVLVLENREADAELMIQELRRAGFDPIWQLVENKAEYLANLETGPDLILANNRLMLFDPLAALKILKEKSLDIPFFVVSAKIEETAIEYMKQGAYDCLRKDRLARLGPSVTKALEEKRLRLEKEKTVEKEISRQARRAEALQGSLYDVAYALNNIDEPYSQMESLIKIAMDTLGGDRALFFRFDPSINKVVFDIGLGFDSDILNQLGKTSFSLDEDSGLIGSVISNRVPINLAGVISDAQNPVIDSEVQSGLWVSIGWGRKLLGILSILRTHKRAFTSQDEQMLLAYANFAAVSLEKNRLFNEAQRRLNHIQALREIDLAITGNLDLRLTLEIIIDRVINWLHVDAADILLLNHQTNTLEYGHGKGFHTNALKFTNLRLGEGHAGIAALEKRIVHISNLATQDTDFLRSPSLKLEKFIPYWAVPLVAKGKVNGVLEIFHREEMNPDQEWWDFLKTLATQAALALDNASLFQNLQRSNIELSMAYDTAIEGWSRALDLHDQETEGHTKRVTEITLRLAKAFGMSENELTHVRRGALLHDIGKMGVPENIINKPEPLNDNEWKIMRRHPTFAFDMLSPIAYLRPALDIPYCHHERWDGSGYPRGLTREQIPFAARLFAVVDVWDALCSNRPYRKAWSQGEALAYIYHQSGAHFDPKVVDAFLNLIQDVSQNLM